MPISIIGTVALDSIKTPHGAHSRILGGSAAYAALAAQLFSKSHIISIIGNDFPEAHLTHLQDKGINLDGIAQSSSPSFHWSGYYEGKMAQAHTLSTDLNALLEFDPVIPSTQHEYPYVFCANFDPILQKKAITQFKAPKYVILDTMNFWIQNKIDELRDVLQLVDILIINEDEIRELVGEDNLIVAMQKAQALGPKRIIAKKGEHGALMMHEDTFFAAPAYPVDKVVDPTGAGDSFAGGFIGYLAQHESPTESDFRKALITGMIVAAHTVQSFSVEALSTLTKEDIHTHLTHYTQFTSLTPNV